MTLDEAFKINDGGHVRIAGQGSGNFGVDTEVERDDLHDAHVRDYEKFRRGKAEFVYPINGDYALPLDEEDEQPHNREKIGFLSFRKPRIMAYLLPFLVAPIIWFSHPERQRRDAVDIVKNSPTNLIPVYNFSHGNYGSDWHCIGTINPMTPFLASISRSSPDKLRVFYVRNSGFGSEKTFNLSEILFQDSSLTPEVTSHERNAEYLSQTVALNNLCSKDYHGFDPFWVVVNTNNNPNLSLDEKDNFVQGIYQKADTASDPSLDRCAGIALSYLNANSK